MIRYLIRNATLEDLDGMQRLAKMLNTVNLPDERSALKEVLARSAASFEGKTAGIEEREFVFVVEDLRSGQVVGSSQVIAQHGTREAPHIFFEVGMAERYSKTLDRHFKHQVLRLGFNYDGPTEIGGLILDPEYRHVPEKLGRQLSLVRFLFIAMNRSCFRERVLAELLPPLTSDRHSLLWEALGRRFTELDYIEADHISRTNKEFIVGLFPEGQIYTCLFSPEVRETIGQVGPESMPAKHLLESIGFSYQSRVDPFDGGPHYEADCNDIDVIQDSNFLKVAGYDHVASKQLWFVAAFQEGFALGARFRAALVKACKADGENALILNPDDMATLGIGVGDIVRAYLVDP